MRFQPKNEHADTRHIVDLDAGIELLEKDWRRRAERNAMSGEDLDRKLTFVFRDHRYRGPRGETDIEFTAKRLGRMVEAKLQDRTVHINVWYGFEISASDFDHRFQDYTGGDQDKLASLRNFVRQALLYNLGDRIRDRTVEFK